MSADNPGFSSESSEPSENQVPPAVNSEYGTGSENDPSLTQEEEWDAAEAAEAALAGTDARSSPDTAATRAEHRLDAQADDQRPVTPTELQAAVSAVEARYEAKLEAAGAEYQEKLEAHAARYEAKLEELQEEIASLKRQLPGNADEPAEDRDQFEPEEPLVGENEILHAQSEFHGEKLDWYSDGKHWVSGDAVRAADARIAVRKDEPLSPADLADRPPTGEQLLDMKSDRPEGRLDSLLDEAVETADDVHDEAGHIAQAIADIANGNKPSGHVTHAGQTVFEQTPPPADAVSDAVGASVVLLAGTAAAVRHVILNHRREPQSEHPRH